jgi:hypothetical protein
MKRTVGRILHRAAEWLEDFSESGGPQTVPADPAPARVPFEGSQSARRLDPTDGEGFNRRLQEFRARHRSAITALMTGSVQILGLSELQKRYGNRWEEIRHTAYRVAEGAIEHRIGPLDLYLVVNSEHYVILFGNASREEAERKARLIAGDILTKLCGNQLWGASISVRGFAVPVEQGLSPDDIVDFDDLVANIRTAELTAEERADAAFAALRGELSLAWRPTLNARKALVSAYAPILLKQAADGTLVPAEQMPPPDIGDRFHVMLDLEMVARLDAYFRAAPARARTIVLPTIHWDTLAIRANREAFLAAFRGLPPESRRRLMPEVVGLPSGTPQSRLREVIQPVWPMTLGLVARLGLMPGSLEALTGAGLVGVSASAGRLTSVDPGTRAQLDAFAAWAREGDFRPVLTDCQSVSVAQAAAKAGFEYLSGDAVLRPTADPDRVVYTPGA